jgi:hypothetical protein
MFYFQHLSVFTQITGNMLKAIEYMEPAEPKEITRHQHIGIDLNIPTAKNNYN